MIVSEPFLAEWTTNPAVKWVLAAAIIAGIIGAAAYKNRQPAIDKVSQPDL
jgi:hypothetical protein